MDGETIIIVAGLPIYGCVCIGICYATMLAMKAGNQLFESTQAQQVQENTAANAPK